CQQVYNPPYNF
nr:immunoglobulin light chain junction region [Macaca mulatta]